MKPVIFLRIASILTLIHSILHTIGGVFGKPPAGHRRHGRRIHAIPFRGLRRDAQLRRLLSRHGSRHHHRPHHGCRHPLAACLAGKDPMPRASGPSSQSSCVGYLALALNSYTFFFSGPVIAELLIVLCLGAAIVTAKHADERCEPSTQSAIENRAALTFAFDRKTSPAHPRGSCTLAFRHATVRTAGHVFLGGDQRHEPTGSSPHQPVHHPQNLRWCRRRSACCRILRSSPRHRHTPTPAVPTCSARCQATRRRSALSSRSLRGCVR